VVTLARYNLLVSSIGLLASLAPMSYAADQPAGVAVCSGTFQVDGLMVSNTATVFVGSRIDSATGVCTIRRSVGAVVRLEPQSGITITDTGITLTRGTVRIKGNSELGISAAKAVIRPATLETVILARFLDNQLLVNVPTGKATLAGPQSELYARLDAGTLMRFAPAPNEPSGMYLWVFGCLRSTDNSRFVGDQHIGGKVELLGGRVGNGRQPVAVWGALEQLPANAPQFAARLRVVQETSEERACPEFTPVSNLNGTVGDSPTERIAVIAAAIAGATAMEVESHPGQKTTSVSVP